MMYSTWEVNPPNPTGYAPNMMITCMNDPGPIVDSRVGSSTFGQLIQDPMYNPKYSNFCYTNGFMPGATDYLDTPVLPVAAFASGYNPVDCAYADATPAIKRVDGDGTFGPWVRGANSLLTITALGDVTVPNNAYAGPSPSGTGLTNVGTITRHYGFGATRGTVQLTDIRSGAVVATLNTTCGTCSWGDGSVIAQLPGNIGPGSYELAIRGANGLKSVDTVTVTVGGTAPIYVTPPTLTLNPNGLAHPIQDAIDAANPGGLIMLQAGTYPELVIMWKPVRLQGVGAASVIINAAKYPTQKLAQWRPRINCFFGLDFQGNTLTSPSTSCPQDQLNAADLLPGQVITGGVVLLEPTALSSEEGAGITVLAKNLSQGTCGTTVTGGKSNFLCAQSRIDGVSVTGGDSGGGIYVNGWAHNLEIGNNRIYGNAGVFNGGIRIGQPYLQGLTGKGPFAFDKRVVIHHNSITANGTVQNNAGESGAGGGLSLCTGTDNYLVNYNFICRNFTTGDGGGIGHIGLSWLGNLSNNSVTFNQSFSQTQTTSGGGIAIEGEPAAGTAQSLGTGDLTVDSNLVMGNSAQGGHGGGIRMQDVNGTDVALDPTHPGSWWKVGLTNNMIVDNVAGWAGGGISLLDTVNAQIVNNTIAANDSTATAGPVIVTGLTGTQSANQPAGISAEPHGSVFATAFGSSTACGSGTPNCTVFSNPFLENNIVYQNRSFSFTVTSAPGSGGNPGTPAPSTLVPALTQTSAGQCLTGANYWDLGVLGQTKATPTLFMNPTFSLLTVDPSNNIYTNNDRQLDPLLAHKYCTGSRANPGTPNAIPPFLPFTFQAAGAQDEGGNWVDLRFGPISPSDSSIAKGSAGYSLALGDYRITGGSPAIGNGSSNVAPNHDFFGNSRLQGGGIAIGAAEFVPAAGFVLNPTSLTLTAPLGGTSGPQAVTVNNTGNIPLNLNISLGGTNPGQFSQTSTGCATLPVGGSCVINVAFNPTTANPNPKSSLLNVAGGGQTPAVSLTGKTQALPYSLTPAPLA